VRRRRRKSRKRNGRDRGKRIRHRRNHRRNLGVLMLSEGAVDSKANSYEVVYLCVKYAVIYMVPSFLQTLFF